MSDYGTAAVNAVKLYTTRRTESPQEAWERATAIIFGQGTSSQSKGCPRDAFLGLCEEGLIEGVPDGKYTRSKKNKKYAIDAVTVLKQRPELVTDLNGLWREVMRGQSKVHNSQMDVVASLWRNGLLTAKR